MMPFYQAPRPDFFRLPRSTQNAVSFRQSPVNLTETFLAVSSIPLTESVCVSKTPTSCPCRIAANELLFQRGAPPLPPELLTVRQRNKSEKTSITPWSAVQGHAIRYSVVELPTLPYSERAPSRELPRPVAGPSSFDCEPAEGRGFRRISFVMLVARAAKLLSKSLRDQSQSPSSAGGSALIRNPPWFSLSGPVDAPLKPTVPVPSFASSKDLRLVSLFHWPRNSPWKRELSALTD